jgi:LPS export ABC transporter protein LptC
MIRVLAGLAVVIALLVTFLIGRGGAQREAAAVADAPAENPGYAAINAEIIETGDDGRPRYRLRAERIEQQPNDLSVSLERPALRYTDERGSEWSASALRGTVPEDRGRVDLEGDVVLSGLLPGSPEPARVATERLSFDTVNEVATTDADVTFDWSQHQLTARGLRADLKRERLVLESRVHGRFVR